MGQEPRPLKKKRPQDGCPEAVSYGLARRFNGSACRSLCTMRLPLYETCKSSAFPQLQVHQSMLCVFTASCSSGVRVWNVERCMMGQARRKGIEMTHQFGHSRKPGSGRAGLLLVTHYLEETCWSLSTAESDSAASPHLRMSVSVGELSMERV